MNEYRGKVGGVLALTLLSGTLLAGCQTAMGVVEGVRSGSCAFGVQIEGVAGDSPMCQASTEEQRLLLTTMTFDRAALSAAKGVDSAQEALGLKRTMQAQIVELDRQVSGFGTGGSDLSQTIISQSSAEAETLKAQIDEMVENDALSDDAKLKLAVAKNEYQNSVTYMTTAALGIKMAYDHYIDNDGGIPLEQRLAPLLAAGLVDPTFLNNVVVGGSKSAYSTARQSSSLISSMNKATKGVELPKAGDTDAKAKTEDDLRRIEAAFGDGTFQLPTTTS